MKKAIVTGANGFVGTHLCRELVSQGVQVIAVIKKGTYEGDIRAIDGLEVIYCDLNMISSLEERTTDISGVLYFFNVTTPYYALTDSDAAFTSL